VLIEERNFAELAGEFARDYFGKRHEAGLRVGRHGEAALEGSNAVSGADPGAEDEGVAAVEGDGSGACGHIASGGNGKLVHGLLSHSNWWLFSDWFVCRGNVTLLTRRFGFSTKFSGRSKPVMHYPVLNPIRKKQISSVSLHRQWVAT
jgi:hypothetical protein